jgi:hypothetical protein
MRILLDECVDERFRHRLPGHDCQTARFAKLSGMTNGKLLSAAESAGFELLMTVDQGIPYQQNFGSKRIAILVLCAPSNRLEDLTPLVSTILIALDAIKPGEVVKLSAAIREPAH